MDYAVIMAGGSGTRLWPLSHGGEPKQLLALFDGRSLLQLAWDRARALFPAEQILVCTGARYATVVQEQLPQLLPQNLLGEPYARDSLNAAAWSSAVLAKRDKDATLVILAADHVIHPVEVFAERIRLGFQITADAPETLITFGIVPTAPLSGFGYLKLGDTLPGFPTARQVLEFKEKPTAEVAQTYIADGGYWWNSGMFIWRADTLLALLDQLQPINAKLLRELTVTPQRTAQLYAQLPANSIDYAVMEPVSRGITTAHIAAIGMELEWRDVGSYAALRAALPQDGYGNAAIGQVMFTDCQGTLAINTAPGVLAVVGMSDVVAVRSTAATLLCPLADSERVKEIAGLLATQQP